MRITKSEEACEFDEVCERLENYSKDDSTELWAKFSSKETAYKLILAWQILSFGVLAIAMIMKGG